MKEKKISVLKKLPETRKEQTEIVKYQVHCFVSYIAEQFGLTESTVRSTYRDPIKEYREGLENLLTFIRENNQKVKKDIL